LVAAIIDLEIRPTNLQPVIIGKIGLAAEFNRSNSERLNVDDNADLSVGDIDFYVSFWIYPTSDDGANHCIMSKAGASGNRAWSIFLDWGDNRIEYTVYNSSDAATTVNSGTVSVNTWYFVECWHNATSNQIGVAINRTETTTAHTTGVKNDTGSFTIGALSNASHYTGRVDEAGFWKNYIPDSTRRDWLYNSGSGRSYTDIYNYGAGAFSLDLKYNSYVSGEFIQMFSAPGGVQQREVFQITSSYTPITGGFRYSAVRNLNDGDGGPFDWATGDAVTSLAAAVGSGFINMTATSTIVGHDGPATVYYVRNGMGAWDAVAPVVADGNLRSFVDYTDDQFGHAAGNDLLLTPELGFKGYTIDTINGMRTFNLDIALYEAEVPFLNIGTVSGIQIETNESSTNDNRSISFNRSDVNRSYIRTWEASNYNTLKLATVPATGIDHEIEINAHADAARSAFLTIDALSTGQSIISLAGLATANSSYINLQTDGTIALIADQISVTGTLGETWSNLSFASGWGNYGSGYTDGQYKKVGDFVFLRGLVKRTSGSSTIIATLPSGYRPSGREMYLAVSGNSGDRVDITTAGELTIVAGTDTATFTRLNGMFFSTL